jgi:hypothetical protein
MLGTPDMTASLGSAGVSPASFFFGQALAGETPALPGGGSNFCFLPEDLHGLVNGNVMI